jgi:lipoic acid synthetase
MEPQVSDTSGRLEPGRKMSAAEKMARIPVKIEETVAPLRKPDWIRVKWPATPAVAQLKSILRENHLHTVCEEASCPNIGECFGKGTATLIMGDVCTRRCPFCDVAHGRPAPLDAQEPENLARTIGAMRLKYVVITSVDRDDLRDGGAGHFVDRIRAVRAHSRTRASRCWCRTSADAWTSRSNASKRRRRMCSTTISRPCRACIARRGLARLRALAGVAAPLQAAPRRRADEIRPMVGLGETLEEIRDVMRDLRAHDCDMLTIGQYLQPTRHHLPVECYVTPEEFALLAQDGYAMGFTHVASGPLVRSSYHADRQAEHVLTWSANDRWRGDARSNRCRPTRLRGARPRPDPPRRPSAQRRQGKARRLGSVLEERGAIQTDPAEGMARPALGAHAAIVQGEIAERMMRWIRHEDEAREIVGAERVGLAQRLETVVGPHVAVDDDERIDTEERQRAVDPAAGLERACPFVRVADLEPETVPVAERGTHLIAEPREIDDDLAHACGCERDEQMLDEWPHARAAAASASCP